MRESFGSTWTMQLVFSFTLLFVSFLTITISYSKAFKVRNEVISILEKNGGYTANAKTVIDSYIRNSGYRARGRCNGANVIGVDLEGQYDYPPDDKLYAYCIKKDRIDNNTVSNVIYEVTMFYKFGLPIVGDLTTFTVKGKTTDLVKITDLF